MAFLPQPRVAPVRGPVVTVRVTSATPDMVHVVMTRDDGEYRTTAHCGYPPAEWAAHLHRNGYAPEQFPVGRTVRL
jgi:hypothetical protein